MPHRSLQVTHNGRPFATCDYDWYMCSEQLFDDQMSHLPSVQNWPYSHVHSLASPWCSLHQAYTQVQYALPSTHTPRTDIHRPRYWAHITVQHGPMHMTVVLQSHATVYIFSPRTCCVDTIKLRGESCRSVGGSSVPEWAKSTLAVLVLPHKCCRSVLNIIVTAD